jgi:hypothetical protein
MADAKKIWLGYAQFPADVGFDLRRVRHTYLEEVLLIGPNNSSSITACQLVPSSQGLKNEGNCELALAGK